MFTDFHRPDGRCVSCECLRTFLIPHINALDIVFRKLWNKTQKWKITLEAWNLAEKIDLAEKDVKPFYFPRWWLEGSDENHSFFRVLMHGIFRNWRFLCKHYCKAWSTFFGTFVGFVAVGIIVKKYMALIYKQAACKNVFWSSNPHYCLL